MLSVAQSIARGETVELETALFGLAEIPVSAVLQKNMQAVTRNRDIPQRMTFGQRWSMEVRATSQTTASHRGRNTYK